RWKGAALSSSSIQSRCDAYSSAAADPPTRPQASGIQVSITTRASQPVRYGLLMRTCGATSSTGMTAMTLSGTGDVTVTGRLVVMLGILERVVRCEVRLRGLGFRVVVGAVGRAAYSV